MKIADLFFKASLDDSRLEIDAKKSGAKAGAAASSGFNSKWTAFKQGIGQGIGITAFSALGSAISGVTSFMGEAIDSASDLAEAQSKANVVFGEGADDITQWAESGAQAFGLSKRAALEAAGTYGNLFQAFGIGREKASEMSTTLVELAADLASFNNTSIEDALEALRSGLSGETEPLKRYGIALSDARMRQTLMEAGVKDLGATLTPLQKSQAAYTLILKDSTLAQGDFSRTSEGLANQQRIVAAELENVKAEVGEGLLPVQLQWEKGNLDLIRSLQAISDVTKGGEVPRDQMIDDLESLVRVTKNTAGPFGFLADMLVDETDKAQDAADATADQTAAINDLTRANKGAKIPMEGVVEATESAADAFRKAQRPGATLKTLLRDLGYEADEADQAIDSLAGTIADELYGDAITAGNEARLKENIKDLRKQREEAKKGSPEWRELTGEIAENQQALFDLHLEQAKKAGPRAVIAFLEQEKRELRKSDTAARRYIDDLIRLYSLMQRYNDLGVISFGRYAGKTIPRAGGGPVEADHSYIVGEEGPEFFVPDQDGMIVANPDLARMSYDGAPSSTNTWASSMDITLNVDARGATNPAATGTAVRQGVHDAMADVLRQQTARLPSGTRS